MTTAESRKKIEQEFMNKYYEFLDDMKSTKPDDHEFGKKYGFFFVDPARIEKYRKDNQTTLMYFQREVFSGRWLPMWEKEGYERKIIWQLYEEGFLSYKYYSNSYARATGRQDFLYISQKTAKEIYKTYKR